MIKVLGFALYGPLAASTRYRLGQYVPGLKNHGIDLQICHLLGDEYLRQRFSGGSLPVFTLLQAGLSRLADLWGQHEYVLAILHCELFPLLPGAIERSLIRIPYLYDFDDAFYLKYRTGRMKLASPVLGNKFGTVIEGATAVTAGNHVLAQYARKYNATTDYLPTVVDTNRYLPKQVSSSSHVFTVGWIGSPSTAPYLSELVEPLSTIGQEGCVRFIVIGGRAPDIPNVTVVEVEWTENTEVDLIISFDVGVMPLPNDDWACGKCAFKLIQYMACAVPVIASPVGANIDVVSEDCGFLAATQQEWTEALRLMRDQPTKRSVIGQAGRVRVEKHYSLEKNLPKLAKIIHETVETTKKNA